MPNPTPREAVERLVYNDIGLLHRQGVRAVQLITTFAQAEARRGWQEIQSDIRQILGQTGVSASAKINQVEQLLRKRTLTRPVYTEADFQEDVQRFRESRKGQTMTPPEEPKG